MENGDRIGRIPLKKLLTFFKIEATNRESLYEKVFNARVDDDVVWNLPQFKHFNKEEMEYEKYIISPHDVEEGVLICHKCGCKKIVSFSRQVRSGDEPMSVFASCTKCRNQWVE